MARIYTEEYRKERDARRSEWLKGNQAAIAFIQTLTDVAELWDDIIDRDRDIQPHEADNAFIGCLVGLPENKFYCEHYKMLQPLVLMAINAWKDSETLKDSISMVERRIAFHQRFFMFEITKMCALLVGGWEHLRKVSPDICSFYAYESFEEWDQEEQSNVVRMDHG
jgi:hypothetical protein